MQGKLFVIEGTDGSGKETQSKKLKERLDKLGIKYKDSRFPNYESESSALVKMYLAGEFGSDAKAISPYIASTFYAVDRYATFKKDFEEFYNGGGILLLDRYTTANMVHQAGKIEDKQERAKFIEWLEDLEFNIYSLPKPNKVIFLNMPIEKSLELTEKRANKITGEQTKDIHENDVGHLKDAYLAACELAKEKDWLEVSCVENGKLRTIEEIHEEIFEEIKKHIN
ncbi:MAG: thymidylate kinase [Eubacteriales bacterium]